MDNDIRCPCSSTFKHIGYVRNGPSITLTPTGTIFSYFSYLYSHFIHPFFSFLHFGQTLFSSTVPPRCRLEVDGGVSRGCLVDFTGAKSKPPNSQPMAIRRGNDGLRWLPATLWMIFGIWPKWYDIIYPISMLYDIIMVWDYYH